MNKVLPLMAVAGYFLWALHTGYHSQPLDEKLQVEPVVFPEIKIAPPAQEATGNEEVIVDEEVTDYIIELDEYAQEGDTVIPLKRVSFYNLVPEQTSPDPSTSSCGPTVERQIGVSRDLFFDSNRRKHLCGARVTVITDNGQVFENYVLNDTMHSRWELTADIVYPGVTEEDIMAARALGVTTGTLIIHAD